MKTQRFLPAIFALMVALAFSSCGGDNKTVPAPEIILGKNPVEAKGGQQFVTIASQGEWSIFFNFDDGDSEWASVSQNAGSGDASVVLTVQVNTSEGRRSCRIIADGKGGSNFVELVQKGVATGGDDPGDDPGTNPYDPAGEAVTNWMELPGTNKDDEYTFVTHYMTIGSTKTRNYSYYYDHKNHLALWVAYPLCSWNIGSGSRNDNAWAYDPTESIPKEDQPNLSSGYKGSPTGGNAGYDRGHQIPSADRVVNDAANKQTFYYTNMTPQWGSTLNQSIWKHLEDKVRVWARACDTLYVVTGCDMKGSTVVQYDNSSPRKACPAPGAYYKALLRKDLEGKYTAVGVWLENRGYDYEYVTSANFMSIDELESRTGWDFFVNLPKVVGEAKAAAIEAAGYNSTDWRL